MVLRTVLVIAAAGPGDRGRRRARPRPVLSSMLFGVSPIDR
jgi:hypothetical protein